MSQLEAYGRRLQQVTICVRVGHIPCHRSPCTASMYRHGVQQGFLRSLARTCGLLGVSYCVSFASLTV